MSYYCFKVYLIKHNPCRTYLSDMLLISFVLSVLLHLEITSSFSPPPLRKNKTTMKDKFETTHQQN